MISKPLNKELNALNVLESRRFDTLQTELIAIIRAKLGKFVRKSDGKEMQNVKNHILYCATLLDKGDGEPQPINTTSETEPAEEEKAEVQGEQSSKQAPLMSTALVIQTSKEEPLVKKVKFDMFEYIPDFTIPSPTPLNSVISSEFSLIPPSKIADDKGKGKADEDDSTKQLTTLDEAKAQMQEIQILAILKAEKEKSEKKLKKV
ncbi:hypothetical protein Tco_0113351, partial [Tanacetum coccineum]